MLLDSSKSSFSLKHNFFERFILFCSRQMISLKNCHCFSAIFTSFRLFQWASNEVKIEWKSACEMEIFCPLEVASPSFLPPPNLCHCLRTSLIRISHAEFWSTAEKDISSKDGQMKSASPLFEWSLTDWILGMRRGPTHPTAGNQKIETLSLPGLFWAKFVLKCATISQYFLHCN